MTLENAAKSTFLINLEDSSFSASVLSNPWHCILYSQSNSGYNTFGNHSLLLLLRLPYI